MSATTPTTKKMGACRYHTPLATPTTAMTTILLSGIHLCKTVTSPTKTMTTTVAADDKNHEDIITGHRHALPVHSRDHGMATSTMTKTWGCANAYPSYVQGLMPTQFKLPVPPTITTILRQRLWGRDYSNLKVMTTTVTIPIDNDTDDNDNDAANDNDDANDNDAANNNDDSTADNNNNGAVDDNDSTVDDNDGTVDDNNNNMVL
ncbi:hypothetical protein EDB89DRAFT_1907305 [Lactarius sanguifluus]|nr:hypothetical protein EDB89DRAFT_1907305 [Lactarius sanguifluus]